ncbi:hypothetical protein T03_11550 [Trichinella britovi]|uniref:Uncharacterized protein n=1 Tax=Trichinella britovi TaxID=45882 RepID=A0A0V1D8D6_TRIBR|nr:hypothetical protein T03_11550 [Trichinella britovi]
MGYKVWMLCGRDGCPYHLNIHQGKESERAPHSERVVTRLMASNCWQTYSRLHTMNQQVAFQRKDVKHTHHIQAYNSGMGDTLSTTKGVPLVKCNVQMLLESETFPGRFWKVARQTNGYVSNKWPLKLPCAYLNTQGSSPSGTPLILIDDS